jgi:pimeloyl-ACP methyl ester carboxylesterase
MHEIMMTYDGDQDRYARLSGHGFRIFAEAVEKEPAYEIRCPVLLICGEKDHAGFCVRYNREWHKKTGFPIEWIKDAGHNSNTDAPDKVNGLIDSMADNIYEQIRNERS